MGEAVLIAGVGEEDMMEVELGIEQEEEKKDRCEEVKDGHDDYDTKEVVKWEKFLPRMVLRVLLVEADDSTRQIIAALLRKCCYRVAAVADGLKAWETLKRKSNDIDLILTEVELPSISGFALLTLVMENDICKNIPVIMMSSHDSISMALKCMLKGAVDFLIKPVRRNELRNLWQHVWRRHTQKVEASSENNAESNHSGDLVAYTQNIEKCNEKGSDSQGLTELKTRSASIFSSGGTQRHEESNKMDKEMGMLDSEVGEAVVCNKPLNLKSLELEEDHDSVKTEIQDKIVRPECSRGNASLSIREYVSNNEVVEPSRKVVDLIGSFDQVQRTADGSFGLNDLRNKFNFTPPLELSLRNGPSELNQQHVDERQTLNHSTASAFSWYSSKPLGSKCISSMYSEESKGNCSDQHAFWGEKPQNLTSSMFARSGQAESQLPGHNHGLPPVSGVSFDDKCSGEVIQTRCCQGSGVSPVWSINQVRHPEDSPFSPNVSFLSNEPQNRNSEPGYHWSGDTAHTSVMLETVHDLKYVVRKDGPRNGSPAVQSGSNDPANHINGSSYGSMGSGSDGNETSAMAGVNYMQDALRTDCLHTSQREAALTKFRLKRKDRCFEKKVRYQSRKRLAEQRPRMKGQFVRQAHADPSVADTG